MRRTTRRREKQQPNETEGFRFAVTLLAAFGTLSYAGYNYLQNTPIDPVWYLLFHMLISAAPILVGGLLLYILIKGFSMEVHDDPNKKISLKEASRFIYSITFFSFSVIFVFSVCIFFGAYLLLYLNLNLGKCFQGMAIIIFLIVAYILRSRYVFAVES